MRNNDIIIQETVKDKLNQLAYQAKNDTVGFKKVLSLAIYDDLIQWAEEYEDLWAAQYLKHRIEEMLAKCPNCFIIPNSIKYNTDVYTNVNLPQSINQWKIANDYLLLLKDEDLEYERIEDIDEDNFLEPFPGELNYGTTEI